MSHPTPAVLTSSLLLALAGSLRAAPEPATGIHSVVSLANLNGFHGFRLDGFGVYDNAGISVASAGDINGDGIADVVVGAQDYDSGAGKVFIVFGSRDEFPPTINLAALDGTNGFRLDGIDSSDYAGRSVAAAGDVNGDKIDDVVIGAPFADPGGRTGAGEVYILFGRKVTPANPFPAAISLIALDGTNGFRLDGVAPNDNAGFAVAAGDVNGDKISDVIIGSRYADPGEDSAAGATYIVFGRKATPFPASISLGSLDGTNGFRIEGIDAGDQSGRAVASAGDVNADKINDLIIGAPGADAGGDTNAGEAYIVFGRKAAHANPFPASISLSTLDGTNGFRLDGIDAFGRAGTAVASAGDINADKISDVIIGAPVADVGAIDGAGEAYVVFGRKATPANPFPASISLSALDGTNGFRLEGIDEGDNAGTSVASAGDVNGDRISDLIIGATGNGGSDHNDGRTFVFFGRKVTPANPFAAAVSLDDLDGTNGYRLFGSDDYDNSGFAVASAGDINGDGRADIIIGAPYAESAGTPMNAGAAYIIFGPAPEAQVTLEAINVIEVVVDDGGTINLGAFEVGNSLNATFRIRNRGLADLFVSKFKGPKGSTTTLSPDAVAVPLESTMFTIRVTPTRPGSFTGKVSFNTNDADEKKYDFNMRWSVAALAASSAPAPVINLDTHPDLNNDWITNAADVALMLRAIAADDASADLNDDDQVNTDDLVILLSNFSRAID